ncbi:uncharacterized protein LOC143902326 [Temnothorax americanus]|uniref:uncharacterized protein LOC143902326 n=1 Tax=Temnothorax americanus TaxID=1964332 RepID=UPI0040693357
MMILWGNELCGHPFKQKDRIHFVSHLNESHGRISPSSINDTSSDSDIDTTVKEAKHQKDSASSSKNSLQMTEGTNDFNDSSSDTDDSGSDTDIEHIGRLGSFIYEFALNDKKNE